VVVLAVKPQMLPDVLPLVTPEMTQDKLLVSIAAGKPTSYYEAQLPEGVGVVRVMSNINARVHAAASAVCGGKYATEEQLAIVREMFSAVGTVYDIAEPMFAASIVSYSICVGAGDTLRPAVLNLFSMWCVRLTLAALLARDYGLKGVWIAMAIELTCRGTLFLIRIWRGQWMKKVLQ
jgi:pyrroline-5-carboxylate reductase